MRRNGLIQLAVVGLLSAVAGGLSVGPTVRFASAKAEALLQDRLIPRLERRLKGDVRLEGVDLSRPGLFTVRTATLSRDDGAVAVLKDIEGAWSVWAALLDEPRRALVSASARVDRAEAPPGFTPLRRRIRVTEGDLRVDSLGGDWRIAGSWLLRLGNDPPRAVNLDGDTEGGIDLEIAGGLPIRPPGSMGAVGLTGVVSRVRVGVAPLRAVATEVHLEGLPAGIEASARAVSALAPERAEDPGPGRGLELEVHGLRLAVDVDAVDRDELRELAEGHRAARRAARPDDGAGVGARAGAGATGLTGEGDRRPWGLRAEDAELMVRSGGVDRQLAPVRLGLDSGGTFEIGLSTAYEAFRGELGARLIPVSMDDRGVSVAFDAWVEDGNIEHPKLAAQPLTGIDARALGLVRWRPGARRLEVELREGRLGPARLAGQFVGERLDDPKRARLGLALDLPSQPCQALIDALPEGTLTVADGMRLEGAFEGGLELAVDMTDIEGTILLEGRGDPKSCEVVEDGDDVDLAALNDKRFLHRWPLAARSGSAKVGPGSRGYVRLRRLPRHVVRSMIVTEDGRFWRHSGVNLSLIRRALKINLTKRGFVYGGSTITQQLMKNLFLSRRKTLARKVEEALLSLAVERVVSKRRLMELYVNVIEFGPDIYGISKASRFYFSKSPTRLTPIEGAFLAAIKPKPAAGPKLARRGRFKGWWHHRLIEVMGWLEEGGYISPLERARAFPYYPSFRGPVLSARAPAGARAGDPDKHTRRTTRRPVGSGGPSEPADLPARLAAVAPPDGLH